MKRATLHTDGGARGNPGPAGIGFYLVIEGEEPIAYKEYIGTATNNQAEYRALMAGLKRAQVEGVQELKCYLDSELVVKQVRGEYKMKNAGLRPLLEEVKKLADGIESVSYGHVRREKNKKADALVNEALDERP